MCGLTFNSPLPNMSRKFVKVVLHSSETLDGLGDILPLALLSWLSVLLSAAGWTTVTPFTGTSQSSTYINCSVYRKVLLKLSLTSKFSSISPVLKSLHWLPVDQGSVFKTPTLVYKFIDTGFPEYFGPHLLSYRRCYNTRYTGHEGANILVVLKFFHSSHTSVNQFGHSFAFDASTVWNSLPVDACSCFPHLKV